MPLPIDLEIQLPDKLFQEKECTVASKLIRSSPGLELLPAPGLDKRILIKGFHVTNLEGLLVQVGFAEDIFSEAWFFHTLLRNDGGSLTYNFGKSYWALSGNTGLFGRLNLEASTSWTVIYTVEDLLEAQNSSVAAYQ